MEQREKLHARGKAREELIKPPERHIGVWCFAEYPQQLRHELSQDLARPLTASSLHPAVMPATHQPRYPSWFDKAEPRERAEGFRIVFGSSEDKISRASEGRGLLKELSIMSLDRRQMSTQIGDEAFRPRIAEKNRDVADPHTIGGQRVGLQVIDHLQAVLEAAQEAVILDQFFRRRSIDAASRCETAKRRACGSNLQLPYPTAPDQLLGLGEKFDLADAAATGFDIVAGDRDSAATLMRIDLALDRMDVLDRRKIEVFPPDKRPQLAQEALAGDAIACNRARFDQRCTFPILPNAFIISERRDHRHRQGSGCRIGAKPEIDTKYVSIAGAFLQNAHQIARHSHIKRLYAVAHRQLNPARVVEKDQIDIARIIELGTAELSHPQHDQSAVLLRHTRIGKNGKPLARRLSQQVAQCCAQGRLGEAAESRSLLIERPSPRKFGHSSKKCDATLRHAQAPHQRLPVFAEISGLRDARGDLGKQRVGALIDEAAEESPFLDGDAAQIRAVAEDRRQQMFTRS